jgi:ferric iron reductase protein FhuF
LAIHNLPTSLTEAEWESLASRFSLTKGDIDRPSLHSVPSGRLLEREACGRYLDALSLEIGSPSRRVTASMLAKRYAFVCVSPVLYAMTMFDKGLRLSLEHCRLESYLDRGGDSGNSRFPNYSLAGLEVWKPAPGSRREWREALLLELFAGHLSPLFAALSDLAKVPAAILWENAAVRILPLYEEAADKETDMAARHRIREDFEYIASTAPGSLFGQRTNPLRRFLGSRDCTGSADAQARTRLTCCLYYEMSAEYCRACPLPQRRKG